MTVNDVVMFAFERVGELMCLGLIGILCMGLWEGLRVRRSEAAVFLTR
jgi:hypothetical protein